MNQSYPPLVKARLNFLPCEALQCQELRLKQYIWVGIFNFLGEGRKYLHIWISDVRIWIRIQGFLSYSDSDSDSDVKYMNPDLDSRKKVMDLNPDSKLWVPITCTCNSCKIHESGFGFEKKKWWIWIRIQNSGYQSHVHVIMSCINKDGLDTNPDWFRPSGFGFMGKGWIRIQGKRGGFEVPGFTHHWYESKLSYIYNLSTGIM